MTQPGDQSRPDFEPPTRPSATSAVQEDAPPRRRIALSRFAGRGIALVVVFVVALCLYLAHRSSADSIIDPPSRRVAAAQPTAPPLTHPLPTTGAPRPAEPLLRRFWGPADDVYPMDLAGFTFSFRTPGSWGCLASSQAGVRWVCVDETGVINGQRPARPSGGIIESDECRAPCAATDYADVTARLKALGIDTSGLHVVDSRTRIDDRVDPVDPALREYRMSRTYDTDGDGRLDRHLWVRIDLNAADQVQVQKMLGDLYDATR